MKNRKNFIECNYCKNLTNNRKFCCRKCQTDYYIDLYKEDTDKSFSLYKTSTKFNFNLADYESEFDFSLIEKHGWYSPTNKNNLIKTNKTIVVILSVQNL